MPLETRKMKLFISLFMFLAFLTCGGQGGQKAFASIAPEVEWEKIFFRGVWDEGRSVEQTTDGGYIVTGTTTSPDTGQDVFLIKTDSAGNTVWEKTFGGANEASNGHSVQQTTDGGYIIAGDTNACGGDVYLIKTDSAGNSVWEKTLGGQSTAESGRSVRQTTDGGYIITGGTYNIGVLLIKTDSDGNMVWEKTYAGNGGISVQQTTDGGYVIAGNTFSVGNGDVYLIKTDGAGNTIWEKTFGSPNRAESGGSVQQTTDGGYIVTGSTNIMDRDNSDIYLIKTDNAGNTIWEKTYGGPKSDLGNSVQQTSDGGYIITGYTDAEGVNDVYLIKTDSDGNLQWQKILNGNCGSSVQQTSDGGYVVAGYSLADYGMGALLVKLNYGEFDVVSTCPENGDHDLPNEVVISFNRDITWGFMSNNISITEESPDGKSVFQAEHYNFATLSENKLSINWEWKSYTKYIIDIPAGSVNDLMNNRLEHNFTLVFDTGDGVLPTLKSIDPADGQRGVALDGEIAMTFSEPINVVVKEPFGEDTPYKDKTITIKNNTNGQLAAFKAFIDPQNNNKLVLRRSVSGSKWSPNTYYTVTISPKSVEDNSGLTIPGDITFDFRTGDGTPPALATTDPFDGQRGVALDSQINIRFSEPVTIFGNPCESGTITVENNNNNDLAAFDSFIDLQDKNKLILKRKISGSKWSPNTHYTVTIYPNSVQDGSGMTLEKNIIFSFTTCDDSGPAIEKTIPSDGDTDVSLQKDMYIKVFFDKPVILKNSQLISLYNNTYGRLIGIEPQIDLNNQKILIIRRKDGEAWAANAQYRLTIKEGTLTDIYGTPFIPDGNQEEFYFYFTTTNTDLFIKSVMPIQVLEGVNLVESKDTAVKVVIGKNKECGKVTDVTVKVKTGSAEYQRFYVDEKSNMGYPYGQLLNESTSVSFSTDELEKTLFFFGDERAPIKPYGNNLHTSAEIDYKKSINEIDESNNTLDYSSVVQSTVWTGYEQFLKTGVLNNLKIVFFKVDDISTKNFDDYTSKVAELLKGVYPLAAEQLIAGMERDFVGNTYRGNDKDPIFFRSINNCAGCDNSKLEPFEFLYWAKHSLYFLKEKYPDADRFVAVVPFGWIAKNVSNSTSAGFFHADLPDLVLVEANDILSLWPNSSGFGVVCHEIGHTYGLRRDVEEYDLQSPGFPSSPGIWVTKKYTIPEHNDNPKPGEPVRNIYCFMGSYKLGGHESWVCAEDYEKLLGSRATGNARNLLAPAQSTAEESRVVLASGVFDGGGNVTLDKWRVLPWGELSTLLPGPYCFEYLGNDNKVLFRKSFNTSFKMGETLLTEVPFLYTIPYIEGTAKILVKYNDKQIKELKVSKNKPALALTSPNGGDYLKGQQVTVSWSAEDIDGDDLSFTALYSSDYGTSWMPFDLDISESFCTLDTSMLDPGKQYLVKVIATDGFNTAEDVSDAPFSIIDRDIPLVGDMNDDNIINLLDLLWIASKIGPASNEDALKADVNNDSQVNILDLLMVEQIIGR